MTIKESAPFTRTELAQELDRNKIGNRMIFGGNLVRQPAFVQLRHDNPDAFRVVGEENEKSRKQNAAGALATSASCNAKLAWRERSEGKAKSRNRRE